MVRKFERRMGLVELDDDCWEFSVLLIFLSALFENLLDTVEA